MEDELIKKIKNLLALLLIIILVISCAVYIYGRNNVRHADENKIIEDNYSEEELTITSSSEKDPEVINTMFANGMNTDDYNELFNYNPTLINKDGNYKAINYNFENRLHYSNVESYLYEMSKSDIVNLYIIGKTHDSRNIYNIEIGKGDSILMLDAGIHAAETANTHLLMKFLIDILNDYTSGDELAFEMLNTLKIAAIPCINPDGYEVYSFGINSLKDKNLWMYKKKDKIDYKRFKYNSNGIDINRSFPTQNAGLYYNNKKLLDSVSLSKTTKSGTYFGGETLGSEPETRAVMYQDLTHYKNAYAYINLHSQGRVLYSGKPNLSDAYNEVTESLCNRIGNITGYKVHPTSREAVGKGNDGTASDFMAELANGLVFSSETGRLSTDHYINNSATLKYSIPAIVVETMNDNYKDAKKFKEEYYKHGIKEMFYDLLKYGMEIKNQ